MFKTRITEMFGIQYPIIAGPMMRLSKAELVSAVSNAGGLGIIASNSYPTVKELREDLRKTKSMTDKPFAVNVSIMMRAVRPFEEYFNTAVEEGVDIFETSGRSPEPYMKLFKDAKAKVMHRCARIRDVVTAERLGADAATIMGFEAAGRIGMEDVTSLVRIPIAVDSVKIPVIAAGGIGDARGFVAALALGAEGVLMGTRFMASKECPIHPKIKEWMLELKESDTMMIQRSLNNPSRVVRTEYTQKVLEMEQKGATVEELLPLISGERGNEALTSGDTNRGTVGVGQVVGLIHEILSVKEIIEGIISEAKLVGQRLHSIGISV